MYVQFRASYAESFKAPGLPQVVAENIARSTILVAILFLMLDKVLKRIRSGSRRLKT